MGTASVKEIREQNAEWTFLRELPETIEGFKKSLPDSFEDNILHICRYEKPERHTAVELIYCPETIDYELSQQLGLNYYRDIRFFFKEREIFADKVAQALPAILSQIERPWKHDLGEMVKRKGIVAWEYGNALPEHIGGFQCYIRPHDAFEYINGSVIFLDYTDFVHNDQLVFYYNVLRDQIFAERKINGIFHSEKAFDCDSLSELEKKLKVGLRATLTDIISSEHDI